MVKHSQFYDFFYEFEQNTVHKKWVEHLVLIQHEKICLYVIYTVFKNTLRCFIWCSREKKKGFHASFFYSLCVRIKKPFYCL